MTEMNPPFGLEKHEKLYCVELIETINDLLEETFKTSQRIKLLCYDVSKNYIAFGASNGSIYIYRRLKKTKFFKLIPSKNSAPNRRISISPQEENILVIDDTGVILILEHCFYEQNFYSNTYTECRGKQVISIKWDNDDRVYIGDDGGTVSVISIRNVVSLPLLHTPFVSLMDLGYPVVQIDTFSHFMLITTECKIYICDTEREMYKQVGRKDKGKSFGACFYNKFEIRDQELLEDFNNHKLFCTRPGFRIWQANFEGEVFYTHKYKNASPQINEIIKMTDDKNANLETENILKSNYENETFGNISIFNKKYLCVISLRSFYIIDPEKSDLIFYFHSPSPLDIRIADHQIFVWNCSTGKLRVLSFFNFETLISNLWTLKRYKLGAQLVLQYKKDVLEWSKYSFNVHLVEDLKSKLIGIDKKLFQDFGKVLDEIEAFQEEKLGEYMKEDDSKIINLGSEKIEKHEEEEQIREEFIVMNKQYELYKNNSPMIMPQFTEMFYKMPEDLMTQLFLDYIACSHLDGKDIHWLYDQYLKHFELKESCMKITEMNSQTKDFVMKSFLEVNENIVKTCTCSFPLPCSKKKNLKYENIGLAISKYFKNSNKSFQKFPYLWLTKINELKSVDDVDSNLPIIVQYGMFDILKKLHKYVTYDVCDSLMNLFVKLKAEKCLHCNKKFPPNVNKEVISWESLGLILIPLIGAGNVLKLFLNRHEFIPKEELSEKFYMTCMFSKIEVKSGVNGEVFGKRTVDVAFNLMTDKSTKTEFVNSLGAFLMDRIDESNSRSRNNLAKISCSYCEIPLKHPVLKEIENLECGHIFHKMCFEFRKRICSVCALSR